MERAANQILTYDQYAERERQGFSLPYVVEIAGTGQSLLFYGAEHTNDLDHPQFADIERRWGQFITSNQAPIALVEGRFNELSAAETGDRAAAIVQGGEAQFLVYLARRDGVAVVSPEPDRLAEANELAKEFGRENVMFFYVMRQLSWWHRLKEQPNLTAETTSMLQLMQGLYKWNDVDFSVEGVEAAHAKLFGKPLPWADRRWAYRITTPVYKDYVTNQLSRRSGELRDRHIFEEIMRYWRQGKSPFLVFGSAHAIQLEPALQAALR
ncbi:MAG TPA: hypothetical protein VLF91_04620 [Candidatus Saccharimonadales bacterium]|nr:hypothetical protein [Candidatus Saccharimonadales bacterium]